ncbi:hypothetical protein [Nocardioides campestrisoli]|uniref:hypothetical protein n=1 Tax=Nocardioides campestrisoli TaxID=2736757 RepID=UPI00163DA55D|nr:hypothetical protein [Nocardioides campestrisoli]
MHHSMLGALVAGGLALTTGVAAPSAAAADSDSGDTLTRLATGSATLAGGETSVRLPWGTRLEGTLNPDFSIDGGLHFSSTPFTVELPGATARVRFVTTDPGGTTADGEGAVVVRSGFAVQVTELFRDESPETNLVRETCTSGEVTATLTGSWADIFTPTTLAGDLTVPTFRRCGASFLNLPSARDALVSGLLAGPGSTLELSVAPVG